MKDEMNNPKDSDSREEIAIVGMAGRFPGASNIAEFWRNLWYGVESISFFSDEELSQSGISPDALSAPNYVKARGVLEGVEMFDASFFGFVPREAEIMDPQQRVFLETAWEALENAGYDSERYKGSIAVYAGAGFSSYLFRFISNPKIMKFVGGYRAIMANDKDHLATLTSYKLNLRGPSVSVQTACSTSLVAVHLACQSLLNGECDMALAGGVSINLPQKSGYFYEEGGIASSDGHCRAFDAKAQGTVAASGVGIVVLRRLSDALTDGDSIQAVIKASAINNDGAVKVGYTAPSVDGQAEAIAEAIEMAGIDAESISYIETHGTATPLGDPVEVAALTRAFRSLARRNGASGKKCCAIGSVKTNIGHVDAAAGVAGLIKTALSLRHKRIPPSLHFEKPNPEIDFTAGPFYVNTGRVEWTAEFPRRAGVSSFGIGGANAHAILEESPTQEESGPSRPYQLLLLSAKTGAALEAMTVNLAEHLKRHSEEKFADVAYTLQVGRRSFSHRRMLVCNDRESAAQALEASDPRKVFTDRHDGGYTPVVFMFPGQGAQRVNMGLELYRNERTYRESVDACCEILKPHLGLDLRKIIYPSDEDVETAAKKLNQTSITQPALFVVEYALARLWMEWGVRPAAMIGHSIGEYVTALIADVFSVEDALKLVATRGKMIQALPGGRMLAVGLQEKELEPLLGEEIALAAVNAPGLCVVSGARKPIEALESRLAEKEIFCRRLETSHAFHSHMMEPILGQFAAELKKLKLRPPKIRYISNVSGQWIKRDEATNADYWVSHLRKTVRFSAGLEEIARQGPKFLLEVGPDGGLRRIAASHAQKAHSSLSDGDPKQSEMEHLLGVLGRLWLAGVEIDWERFYAHERRSRAPLPTYPFERRRYWVEPQQHGQSARTTASYHSASDNGSATIPWRHSSPNGDSSLELEQVMRRQLDLISKQLELLRSQDSE
jgi:acyl transferase domain-containing protein